MSVGRVVSAALTAGAVGGCALLAVSMAHAASDGTGQHRAADRTPVPRYSVSRSVPVYRVVTPAPPRTTPASTPPTTPASTSTAPATTSPAPQSSTHPPARTTSSSSHAAASKPARTSTSPAPRPKPKPSQKPAPKPAPKPKPHGSSLPLPGFYTGSATKVITVVAHSHGSTTATLQAWTKASGGGWLKYGPAIYAHVGAEGLTSSPSEWKSATPIGSFSLTQAFGRYSDPGTALPYFKTDAADWWISQSGSLYNTHQHCWSGCPFTRGSPNEHLYYETPYYNYAVVIDYNRFPVHQGAGSAFFLHVTDGRATAGCVAIPQDKLVPLMRWLNPSAHPRILIGVT